MLFFLFGPPRLKTLLEFIFPRDSSLSLPPFPVLLQLSLSVTFLRISKRFPFRVTLPILFGFLSFYLFILGRKLFVRTHRLDIVVVFFIDLVGFGKVIS